MTAVVVRKYQENDKDIVHSMFSAGMWGLVPTFIKQAMTAPTAAALWLVQPVIAGALLHRAATHGGRVLRWPQAAAIMMASTVVAAAQPLVTTMKTRKLMKRYITESLADDLKDITGTYKQEDGSAFWVAELDGKVVGCVGLHARGNGVGELRRMSVLSTTRRAGVGTALLKELMQHARAVGMKSLFLTTSSAQAPAISLYARNGWRTTLVKKFNDTSGWKYYKMEADL